jgi:integrase
MPSIEMTARWLERLALPSKDRIDYFDSKVTGLGLRAAPTGRLSWFVMYRVKGEKLLRRLTLGTYPAVSLADAREQARAKLLDAERGSNPSEAVQQDRAAPTFGELVAEYLARHATKNRTADEQRRILEKDVLPAWKHRKANKVTKADVIALVEAIADRGAPVMANRTLNLVGRVFRWGMRRSLVDHNPAALVEPPGEERERDRVLSDAEIRAVWSACGEAGAVGTILRLALLTGQRRGELERMRWADVDLEAAVWTIPAEHAKNKQAHRVPLSGQAVEVLHHRMEASKGSPLVFPSRIGGGSRPLTNISKPVDKIRAASGVEFWPHDLRRTVATGMGLAGVPRFIIGKVLNLTSVAEAGMARVTAVYDRYEYDTERRDALDRWAMRLNEILAGKPPKIRELRVKRAGVATMKGAAR